MDIKVVAYLLSPVYGIATYVGNDITDVKVLELNEQNDIFSIVIEVGGHIVTNIYKPPSVVWPYDPVPSDFLSHPSTCLGDFNSHHMSWGYNANDTNGDVLKEWSENRNLFSTDQYYYKPEQNLFSPSRNKNRDGISQKPIGYGSLYMSMLRFVPN